MPSDRTPFSKRQGYVPPKEIVYRDDLPGELRVPILKILRQYIPSSFLWERIGDIFNPYGTDQLPLFSGAIPVYRGEDDNNIAARRFFLGCEWFQIFDVVEDVFAQLDFHERELVTDPDEEPRTPRLQSDLNDYFEHVGIGWQIVNGKVVVRGSEVFQDSMKTAVAELMEDRRPTAAGQIHEALQALSRRPEPNLRGAVVHSMGALECLARDVTGDAKATLGVILKHYPDLLPKPVDEAMSKLWGFASNEARHVEEGREPTRDDAEMIVALTATIATYLTRKCRGRS